MVVPLLCKTIVMKTIIVPTDFSAASENALQYAIGLAKETSSSLLLFHAYQVPVNVGEVPIALMSVEDLQRTAENKMEELKTALQLKEPFLKIYSETILGDTVDELETICEKISPFAVVMGSHGAGLEKVFFGSTTLKAIKHLHWPVIVVPPVCSYHHIARVGFACDFNKVVEHTPVQAILNIVQNFNAKLYVLNVDHNSKHFTPDTPEQSLLLHTLLEKAVPEYFFIDDENTEHGINRFAEENKLDLVIVIPKKHNMVESLFKKSHTKQLVFSSHTPLMCVHE